MNQKNEFKNFKKGKTTSPKKQVIYFTIIESQKIAIEVSIIHVGWSEGGNQRGATDGYHPLFPKRVLSRYRTYTPLNSPLLTNSPTD